ncbi:MAG: hypothetical protein PHU37_08750 [Methanoculleus chikugoensis]|nr:hypothetical protein [Methanoculleus chikugoensis]
MAARAQREEKSIFVARLEEVLPLLRERFGVTKNGIFRSTARGRCGCAGRAVAGPPHVPELFSARRSPGGTLRAEGGEILAGKGVAREQMAWTHFDATLFRR